MKSISIATHVSEMHTSTMKKDLVSGAQAGDNLTKRVWGRERNRACTSVETRETQYRASCSAVSAIEKGKGYYNRDARHKIATS